MILKYFSQYRVSVSAHCDEDDIIILLHIDEVEDLFGRAISKQLINSNDSVEVEVKERDS